MNICFFLGGFHQNGGIGRVTAMLANALSESDDYSITALCYYNPNQPNLYDVSPRINQQFFLHDYSSMTKQLCFGGIGRLRKFLQDYNIAVLIACGALYYPISVLACKDIKTKCICWEHSDPEGNNDHRGQYWARRFGIIRSDLNVVLTKRALKVFKERYKAERTVQIYNPVDEAVFKIAGDYNAQSTRIISVGRLTYQKNFQAAVRIASKVLPAYPDWEWDVYGKGEDHDELEQMVREAGIQEQMHFKGQIPDLYYRYKDYGIMVMTSRYEGFPMALLEGIGNGLPLISFDILTGPSEIIDDGKNGYLLPEGKEDEMAERLADLMRDSTLRIRMSNASKEKSSEFRMDDICMAWSRTIHSLL